MDVLESPLSLIISKAEQVASAARRLGERLPLDPKLAQIMLKGIDTFGDAVTFAQWLTAPNQILGRSPVLVLLEGDMQLVEDELGRIEYGVF